MWRKMLLHSDERTALKHETGWFKLPIVVHNKKIVGRMKEEPSNSGEWCSASQHVRLHFCEKEFGKFGSDAQSIGRCWNWSGRWQLNLKKAVLRSLLMWHPVRRSSLPKKLGLNKLARLHLVWAIVIVIVNVLLDRSTKSWKLWWRIARGWLYQLHQFSVFLVARLKL